MTSSQTPPGSVGSGDASDAIDPLLGNVFSDRYRIMRKLGEGGMGAVYLAEHVFIEKKVALKVLAPELARRQDLSARFLQEAKSASKIDHENVIDISDFGQSSDGFVYIAMEFLDGMDLGHALREGPMSWKRAQPIILQIGKALRAAHTRGIVHRDMKPENIYLIQRDGRPDFVKLLDFGIAKVMGIENAPRLTRTGMIFGTPEYMAPEQAEGKDADHRVDIYAMGCVIYHLLTGEPPFRADSFMATLTKHLLEDPVPPSVRRPDLGISPALDAIVAKALEKDRDKRFQSMEELMDAVEAVQTGTGVANVDARAATVALGGADLPVIRSPSARRPESDVAVAASDDDLDLASLVAGRSRRLGRSSGAFVAGGIGILAAGALAWWLLSGRTPTSLPTAQPQIPSSPTPSVAPTPASAPDPGSNPGSSAQNPGHDSPTRPAPPAQGASHQTGSSARTRPEKRPDRHVPADPEGDPSPIRPAAPAPGPNVPPELKPFPQ